MIGRSFWPVAVGVDEERDRLAQADRARLRQRRVGDGRDARVRVQARLDPRRRLLDAAAPRAPRPPPAGGRVDPGGRARPRRRGRRARRLPLRRGASGTAKTTPPSTRRAVDSLLTASEAAFSRADLDAARAHLERALEFADDDARPTAQLARSRLEYIEGNLEGVLRELELIEAQLGPDDAELRSDMLGWRSRACWLTGRWDEAFSSANAAVAALDGLPESPQLARALARRSQIEMLKHHDDAIPHAEEAIAVARRVGDLFAEVNARINLFTEQATWGIAPDPDELLDIVDLASGGRGVRRGLPRDRQLHLVCPWLHSSRRGRAGGRGGSASPWGRDAPVLDRRPMSSCRGQPCSSLPAGRWHEVDEVIDTPDEAVRTMATNRIVWLALVGGMAMRRGDLQAAEPPLEELRLDGSRDRRGAADRPDGLRRGALAGRCREVRGAAVAGGGGAHDARRALALHADGRPVVRALAAGRRSRRCSSAPSTPCAGRRARSRGDAPDHADRGRGPARAVAGTSRRCRRAADGGRRGGARARASCTTPRVSSSTSRARSRPRAAQTRPRRRGHARRRFWNRSAW